MTPAVRLHFQTSYISKISRPILSNFITSIISLSFWWDKIDEITYLYQRKSKCNYCEMSFLRKTLFNYITIIFIHCRGSEYEFPVDHINNVILRVSEMLEIAFEVTGIRNNGGRLPVIDREL